MIHEFIERFAVVFKDQQHLTPWQITDDLAAILSQKMKLASDEYTISDGIMIHRSAIIEQNVVIKAPAIVSANCFVGANAYLRGPVYLDESVKIGAGCEIKQSIIFSHTAVAHFNYIGNSIIGSHVNFEAGSVAANHYNERLNKMISVLYKTEIIETFTNKFGSLVGDHSRIGANAVLSPGTLLPPHSIVGRLQLVQQLAI